MDILIDFVMEPAGAATILFALFFGMLAIGMGHIHLIPG